MFQRQTLVRHSEGPEYRGLTRAALRSFAVSRSLFPPTSLQAALDTLKMMLCSPSFLYFSEITAEKDPKLGPYDLASRLSYALWSAPPDQELFAAAAARKLTAPGELRAQGLRLIADDRVGGFVHGFLDSWLNLRDLGSQPPARESTRVYYAENLPEAMKTEVRLFFRHLLQENGPVQRLLDADYTFADKRLAHCESARRMAVAERWSGSKRKYTSAGVLHPAPFIRHSSIFPAADLR